MATRNPVPPRARGTARRAGFARHDLFILAALVLLALAIVLPRLLHGQWLRALLGLLVLAGAVLGGLGLLLAVDWVQQQSDRPAGGWQRVLSRAVGDLGRVCLFGFIGAALASALAANHRLGPRLEDRAALGLGALGAAGGLALYHRLGKARFWPAFGWFALALLGAFAGGILGLLGPDPWGVDLGILAPLLLFLVLALLGHVAPAPVRHDPDSRSHP